MDFLVSATVQGSPRRPLPDSAWSAYKDQVLAALVRWSDLPSEVVLPSFGLPGARGAARGIPAGGKRGRVEVTPALSTVLSFTLDTAGALEEVHVAASSLSGGADTSAIAMIEQAAATGSFPHVPEPRAGPDSVQLYLVVEAVEPVPGMQVAVLGQLEVPAWSLSRPARLLSGLPRSNRRHGDGTTAGDSITVTMVVDSTGQVAKGTARFEVADQATGSPEGTSEARVLEMLPALRFEPAMIGSCRVSTVVTQSFATADVMASQP